MTTLVKNLQDEAHAIRAESGNQMHADLLVMAVYEIEKWKRLYENTVVQKEGMELYEEIKRLSNRVYELENIVKKGVWPK